MADTELEPCPVCDGTGEVQAQYFNLELDDWEDCAPLECPACEGSGEVKEDDNG